MNRSSIIAALILCAAPMLSGCVLVAAGGAVAGVSAARQERSFGNALDDVAIRTKLNGRLAQESTGLFLRVSTTVVEGRVLLAGRVATPEARLDATRIAWSVEGVRRVDNDLEVADTGGWLDGPADFIMRAKLATTLLADKDIKDINYSTDVVHGVVYLMGVAQSQAEVDKVVAHAEKLNGVKRVENYVVLKDDPIRYGFSTPTTAAAPATTSTSNSTTAEK
jgi:osmotically-inducible protein OsmY